ncbi:MAG: FAD-dependent oxidoreductase [Candidatus Buchananbacteria bacterium]
MVYDTIIIGAGPAGMSAGVYVCRKKIAALVLSKDIGGQMAKSWGIENYLGYNIISGADLAKKFKDHLDSFKCLTSLSGVEIEKISRIKKEFLVKLKDGSSYIAKTIIIASGKAPRKLGAKGEEEFLGRGLTYCATCDAPLFANKIVAVVGDGNSALGATYQLNKIASQVYLLVTGSKFKKDLDKILMEKTLSAGNLKVIFDASVVEINGSQIISGLDYKDNKSGKIIQLPVQGVFVEIGSVPAIDFCKKLVKTNKLGEIIIDRSNMTSVKGIFAAGDVTDVYEKQTIIAAGEGAKAAIGVARYLSSH